MCNLFLIMTLKCENLLPVIIFTQPLVNSIISSLIRVAKGLSSTCGGENNLEFGVRQTWV